MSQKLARSTRLNPARLVPPQVWTTRLSENTSLTMGATALVVNNNKPLLPTAEKEPFNGLQTLLQNERCKRKVLGSLHALGLYTMHDIFYHYIQRHGDGLCVDALVSDTRITGFPSLDRGAAHRLLRSIAVRMVLRIDEKPILHDVAMEHVLAPFSIVLASQVITWKLHSQSFYTKPRSIALAAWVIIDRVLDRVEYGPWQRHVSKPPKVKTLFLYGQQCKSKIQGINVAVPINDDRFSIFIPAAPAFNALAIPAVSPTGVLLPRASWLLCIGVAL
jgi:hypothetical protein